MAIYADNVSSETQAQSYKIELRDQFFYPYLKFLLNDVTNIPNENIYIKDYGENNPFLTQGGMPKIFCELLDMQHPTMSAKFDGLGNTTIFTRVMYRIYFVNDSYRAPFLVKALLKINVDELNNVTEKFIEASKNNKNNISYQLPSTITMKTREAVQGLSVYPIVIYDITMQGFINYNIDTLKNEYFDSITGNITLTIK